MSTSDTMIETPCPFQETARVMRILAEPTRLRVLEMLRSGEMNVTALCKRLTLAQPTVSHHLGLLREEGLLISRRDGKHIFYAVNEDAVGHYNGSGMAILAGGIELRLNGLVDGEVEAVEAETTAA